MERKRIPHNYTPKLEDSLFVKEPWLKNYIKNIDDMKLFYPKSDREINCICPNCKFEVRKTVKSLTRFDFYSCEKCGTGTKIPEKFYICYFDVKKMNYKYQVKKIINDNIRYFDFFVDGLGYVEVHGGQHTNKKSNWYERTHKSDIDKRKYCKDNDYTLLEQLCGDSHFDKLVETVNNTKELPNISKDEEIKIKKLMLEISCYDIENIIALYDKYKSSRKVAEEIDVTQGTVLNLLNAHGIDTSVNNHTLNRKRYEKEVIQMYQDGISISKIAKKHNKHETTIYNILKDNNIELTKKEIVKSNNTKQVLCITTGEVFESATKGAETYNVNFRGVSACCNSRQKSAGKLADGTKLVWEYITVA